MSATELTTATSEIGLPTVHDEPGSRDYVLWLMVVVCSALILLAIIGPWIAPYPPDQTDILNSGQGPSPEHWFGTDALGRDIFSRLLAGARLSFLGPGLVVVVSTALGSAVAIASAWYGGAFDAAVTRVINVMFAFPSVLLAVLAVALFGPGFWAPVIALVVAYVPYLARLVRSVALRERQQAYVESSQLAGLSAWRINTRHIGRNVAPVIVAVATIGFGSAMIDFGMVSFLGLGVQPPQADWGLMVSDGRAELLNGDPSQTIAAGLAIVFTVVSFNLLGDRLSSRADSER